MKRRRLSIDLLFLAGFLFAFVTGCGKTDDPVDDFTSAGTVKDADGNKYQTVKIGTQVWMAENLRYLPKVAGPGTGSATEAYYYVVGYDGTDESAAQATSNYETYGVLYNWTAAMSGATSSSSNPSGVRGICPKGWHLPSDAEWAQLTEYLGGDSIAGGKLKETGTNHWISPNLGATNLSNFTALPGGFRNINGLFEEVGLSGKCWSATAGVDNKAWFSDMDFDESDVYIGLDPIELGFSVRCVRD